MALFLTLLPSAADAFQSQLARWLFDKYRTKENIQSILKKVRLDCPPGCGQPLMNTPAHSTYPPECGPEYPPR